MCLLFFVTYRFMVMKKCQVFCFQSCLFLEQFKLSFRSFKSALAYLNFSINVIVYVITRHFFFLYFRFRVFHYKELCQHSVLHTSAAECNFTNSSNQEHLLVFPFDLKFAIIMLHIKLVACNNIAFVFIDLMLRVQLVIVLFALKKVVLPYSDFESSITFNTEEHRSS